MSRDAWVQRLLTLDDRGRADKAVVYRQLAEEFGLPGDLAAALRDHFRDTYQSFCAPCDDAIPVLSAVRAAGLKTGIITNGDAAVQDHKIATLGFAPYMDVILVSEREGIRKPQAEIFERALERLRVDAAAAWFVGDHPEADVRGAADAGLTAVHVRTWAEVAPGSTYSIARLTELLPLLNLLHFNASARSSVG